MVHEQKTGDEHFHIDGMPAGYLLNDFWRWQSSDLLNNTLRGVLAEFIVAKALGIDTERPREEWGAYDLLFNDQLSIEVKSSSYVQSWEQSTESTPRFTIRPTCGWDSENGYVNKSSRQSDMYIFCVFAEKNRAAADPLILDQWDFYPVLAEELDASLPGAAHRHVGNSTTVLPRAIRLRYPARCCHLACFRKNKHRSTESY